MNKAYKVVWSKVKHCYVVVSELAKSHTKAPKSGIIGRSVVAGVLACVLSCGAVMPVYADVTADYPTGFAQREPGFWSALQNMLDSRYGVGNTEFITGWRSDIGHGSAISFFNIDKSVVGHSTSDESLGVATDGYFFQNEGLYRVLDVSNVSNNNSLYVDNFSGNFGVKYYGINSTEGTNVDGSGAVGPDAIALGKDTLASGNQSISIGVGNQVTGNNSGAIGDPNIVNGDNSYVVGNNSTVHANIKNAFVLGNNTTVSNGLPENWDTMTDAEKEAWANSLETTDVKEGVVALGNNIFVSLDNKSPVSRSSTSEGTPEIEHVVAVGDNVVIGEENAIGIGHTATSTALNTIAMGDDAQATMEGAIAVGHSTRATNAFSNALGYLAQATAEGAGAFGQDARATGKFTVAFGRSTRASAESATAIGNTAHAVSQSSIAIGISAIANGGANTNAVAIGRGATIGSDTQGYGETLAVGSGTNVQNTFGSALGSSASVTGQKGTAIGYNSSVTATNAVALGADSVANAANTVSVGSASATRKIVNVTDGTANTDASTVNQTGNKLNLSGSTLSLQTLTGTTLDSVTLPQGVSYTAGNGLVLTGTQFSVKSGTNITVDENGVSVNGTGVIDENNTGLINGGTLYNEVNVASNGNYIVAGDTTAQNLGKLDTAVKNVDNSSIKSMTANGTTVTYTKGDGTTGTFTTQDTNTEYTAGNGLELTGTEFKAKAGTNVTVDANGISVTGNGTVASGNTGLVSGGTVFGETRVASDGNYIEATNTASQNLVALDNALKDNADALDGKANVALDNITNAGKTVIKTNAKEAVNVVGSGKATVNKTDISGVDTYTVGVTVDGAVAEGNTGIVDGGTVYNALQAQKTATDTALTGKANIALDNITDAGKTVIQNATNVVSGDSVITVTPTIENGVKTYTVTANVSPDGQIAEGNTGLVSGGTVYSEVRPSQDGNYIATTNTTGANLTALDTQVKANADAITTNTSDISNLKDLSNITEAGQNVIKELSKGSVNVVGTDKATVTKSDVNGVDTYTVSVKADGQVAQGNENIVSGGTVYDALSTTKQEIATNLDGKANVALNNVTDAGHTVIKTDAKSAINVVGGTYATVDKTDVNGVDTYTVNVATDGAVAQGNNKLVTGGTVYDALQAQKTETRTALDGKANVGLDNITDTGKSVVRTLAQESVKVVNGSNTTVTEGTDGTYKTYAVNTKTDGTVVSGDTGIVTGGAVYDAIQNAISGSEAGTANDLSGKANVGLDNITDAGKNVIKSLVNVTGIGNVSVAKTNVSGVDTYTVSVDDDVIKPHYVSINSLSQDADSNYNNDGASGQNAIAIGQEATATAKNAVAIGYKAKAEGEGAFAFGEGATSKGKGTVAFTGGNKAYGTYSMAWGMNNIAGISADGTEIFMGATAFGTGTEARNSGATAMGNWTIAEGQDSVAMGNGSRTREYAKASLAMGQDTQAAGSGSFAGGSDSIAGGFNSFAFGDSAEAAGDYSTAIGDSAKSIGEESVALGYNSKAYGDYSVAILGGRTGNGTFTYDDDTGEYDVDVTDNPIGAFAAGFGSVAMKDYTVAIGRHATVNNDKSMALGEDAIVSADNSVALGTEAVATEQNVISVGHKQGDAKYGGGTYDTALNRRIVNVAEGTNDTDAVNVKQLTEAVGDKANEDLDNITDAGHSVIKSDAKSSINVVGADKATVTKADVNGVDTYTVSVKADGAVADGNENIVSGGTVYNALQAQKNEMNTALDGKANIGLDNITDNGKTVVRTLAQEAVKVVNGTNTTVTEGTDGNAKTYAVNVTTNGTVTSGDTGVVTGGTVYDAIQDIVTGDMTGKANISLDNVNDAGHNVIKTDAKSVIHVAGNEDVTVSKTDVNGVDTYNVALVKDGAVASGEEKVVTGGIVYDALVAETRPAQDGNYIVKDDTAGENLTALDEAVKANEDAIATNAGDITNLKNLSNITEAGKTVIKNLAKGSVNVVGVDKATVTKSDVNGVDTYTVSVKADGQVAQGDINIVSGDTVYQALQTERATTDVALDDKANIGLDNITDAGHTVIKTDAKASITVTGGTDALVTKTDVNGVDTYAVSINKNGAVAQGNEEIVTGGTVYDALQGQRNEINTVLDTKANIDLDNITNNGKTVVRNLAKESVKVISGSEYVTVTEGTDGNAKTYAVGVLVNGAVESGNTGLATGNTVFNEVRVGNDGYYVLKSNTAGQNITVLDRVLKETRDIAEASALTGTDDNAVHYDGTDKSTVTLAGAEGTLLTNLKDGEISATSTDAVTGKQLFETNERIGQVETRVDTLETTVGTMTDGNYIGADKSVGENLSVLDSELKNVSDGLNTVTNDIGELRDDLDGKLNTNMDNLTSDGESVISTIAKNAVKVEGTGLATVTSAEKNNAMVYTVDVQANGKVEEGNTNLVDGGTVYDAVQDAKDYADGLNTETRDYVTEKLKDKADTDLGNITEAGKEKIRETMKDDLDKKANVDASNINPDVWVEKLGVGEVADGNTGLVNGDTVYKALPDVVKADFDAGVIHVGGTPKYDGIGVVDISNSQGEGRVLTGVVTDPGDANSAANVGYVNAIGKSIIQGVNGAMSAMDSKINKVGANAAALASLNPGSLDGDEKFGVAAAIGNYRDATAGAVGLFYKPQDNLTMNVRGSFGTDENMVGAGVYVALNKGNTPGVSKAQLVKTVNAQAERIQRLEAQVAQLIANASH